jgi:hypothetical protein
MKRSFSFFPFEARSVATLFTLVALAVVSAPPRLEPLLQGQWPRWSRGVARDVKVSGNYAYVAGEEGGLQVIDVSNPTNCVGVGGFDTSGTASGVAVSGNYAYIADADAGLQVIDVSNPTNCVRVGGFKTIGYAYGVAVSDNYAYVTDDYAGLQVIDVSNPANCVRVGG